MENKKQLSENNIRMAISLIQEAKQELWGGYDDYADIQQWMHEAEMLRSHTELLLSHILKGELK